MKVKRGLAFKKRSNKPWDTTEVKNVYKYCGDYKEGDTNFYLSTSSPTQDIIFDSGIPRNFMYNWTHTEKLDTCSLLYYEDVFEKSALANIY